MAERRTHRLFFIGKEQRMRSGMRVALLNTFDTNGGAARAVYRLFQGLGRIGIERTLYVARQDSAHPGVVAVRPESPAEKADWEWREAAIRAEEAPYPTLKRHNFSPFHSERAARAELLERRLKPADVINLHWTRGLTDWDHFLSNRSPDVPLIWTLHDQHVLTGGCHYAGDCTGFTDRCGRCPVLESDDGNDLSSRVLSRKRTALATFKGPLHLVAPSRWMAEQAQRSALFRDRPVHVIPNGLDSLRFRPRDANALRDKLGIRRDATVLLCVAHDLTDPRKGYDTLRTALDGMTLPDGCVLVLIGHGTVRHPKHVRTIEVGSVASDDDMALHYSMADLLVAPSAQDNYPNTALEAMACGTPVLGFPIGGLIDLAGRNERGFLAAGSMADDLAHALANALSDRRRLGIRGSAARDFVERECTLERQAERYASLYADLHAQAKGLLAKSTPTRRAGMSMPDRRDAILALTPAHGGMSLISYGVWDFLFRAQAEQGIVGDGLEIGVFRGTGAAAICLNLQADERFCGIDRHLDRDGVLANIASVGCGGPVHIDLLAACSRHVRRVGLADSYRGNCRFLHIDGEHSYDAVRSDLDLCVPLMADGGIVCVDDFFNPDSVCVTHAVFDHVRDRSHDLRLFLCGGGKAYLCAPRDLKTWRTACLDQLVPFLETVYGTPVRLSKNSHAWELDYLGLAPRGDGAPYLEIGRYRDTPPV